MAGAVVREMYASYQRYSIGELRNRCRVLTLPKQGAQHGQKFSKTRKA
jgi:hypothetical protein